MPVQAPEGIETPWDYYPFATFLVPSLPPIPTMEQEIIQTQAEKLQAENLQIIEQIKLVIIQIKITGGDNTANKLAKSLEQATIGYMNLDYVNPVWPTSKNKRFEIYGLMDDIRVLEAQYRLNVYFLKRLNPAYDGVPIITSPEDAIKANINQGLNTANPVNTGFGTGLQTNFAGYTPTAADESGINWLYVVIVIVLIGVGFGAYKYLK